MRRALWGIATFFQIQCTLAITVFIFHINELHNLSFFNINFTMWACHTSEYLCLVVLTLNLSPTGQNGRYFADDIFICIFVNEKFLIVIRISLKFVPKRPIENSQSLVHRMVWCRPGNKPLSEPMMVNLPAQICVTRPQWVKVLFKSVA